MKNDMMTKTLSRSNCNWLHLYLFQHKILIKFSSIHWSFRLFYYHRCFVILLNAGDIFSSTKKRDSIPICPTETTTERKKNTQFLSPEKWMPNHQIDIFMTQNMRNACKAFDKILFWIYKYMKCLCVCDNHMYERKNWFMVFGWGCAKYILLFFFIIFVFVFLFFLCWLYDCNNIFPTHFRMASP